MKPGDTIRHVPSNETWLVAAVSPDGKDVICCGWPETMAAVANCELVKACDTAQAIAIAQSVVDECGNQCRASWAREWLRTQEGKQ